MIDLFFVYLYQLEQVETRVPISNPAAGNPGVVDCNLNPQTFAHG